jgi:hypothetical protein
MQKAHRRRRLAREGCLFNQETRMRKPLSEPTEGRTRLSRRTLFAGARRFFGQQHGGLLPAQIRVVL